MHSLFVALFAMSLITGCASGGNCRQQAAAKQSTDSKAPGADPGSATKDMNMATISTPQDRVKVFKYDGSLQCGTGKAISLDEMKNELSKFKIYSSEHKSDGLMHMQVCGAATGKANVYEVDRKDLADVKKLGFKEWLWD